MNRTHFSFFFFTEKIKIIAVVLLKKIGFWGDESSMWERDRGSNRKVMEMNDNGAVALSQRNDKIIEKNE